MKPKILIIEDNSTNFELMRYLLAARACDITAAVDGPSGLRKLEQESFDLVICDIAMPGMDGYQVLERARANAALLHLPFIAVTAFAMEEDRHKILSSGFDACLTKPITPKTFAEEVLRYVKSAQIDYRR